MYCTHPWFIFRCCLTLRNGQSWMLNSCLGQGLFSPAAWTEAGVDAFDGHEYKNESIGLYLQGFVSAAAALSCVLSTLAAQHRPHLALANSPKCRRVRLCYKIYLHGISLSIACKKNTTSQSNASANQSSCAHVHVCPGCSEDFWGNLIKAIKCIFQRTDHAVQRQSPEAQYQQKQWACGGLQCSMKLSHICPSSAALPEVSSILPDNESCRGSKDKGWRCCTDCEAPWGNFFICDAGMYKWNWCDLTLLSFVGLVLLCVY